MGSKRVEHMLKKWFYRYGDLVGRRPLFFFLCPLLATLLLTPGIFFMKIDDDVILLFTPKNAPSRRELRVFHDFKIVEPLIDNPRLNTSDNRSRNDRGENSPRHILLQSAKNVPQTNYHIFISVAYENKSNLMTAAAWRSISDLINFIYRNYTSRLEDNYKNSRTLKYNPDFCDAQSIYKCPPLDRQIELIAHLIDRRGDFDESKIRFTYPVMYLWSRPLNWGQFIFGAQVNKSNRQLLSAAVAVLRLEFQFDTSRIEETTAKKFMLKMSEFVSNYHRGQGRDSTLRFYFNSEWYLNSEVSSVESRIAPYIAVTAIFVTVFALVLSYYVRSPALGATEALSGVAAIGLSLAASFAVLFISGVSLNFVIVMTPFLTLCVGIDNDFLLISAWRKPEFERLSARKRFAKAFADAGPNLTITSVNDILCFAVGCLSESPAISDFCLCTCVSLLFRFVYQLTFFSGVLVYLHEGDFVSRLCSKMMTSGNRLFGRAIFKRKETKKSIESTAIDIENRGHRSLSISDPDPNSKSKHVMHRFFRHTYSNFISLRPIRILVVFLFFAYLILAVTYASKLRINISVQKLIADDSPLKSAFAIFENYMRRSQIGEVLVTKAPDFRRPKEVDRFLEFVRVLERTPEFSPEPKDTSTLWLRDYLDFKAYLQEDDSDFYDYLDQFFDSGPEYAKYVNDLRFAYTKNGSLYLDSFRFTTFYQNVDDWDDSARLLKHWRRVCRNYSDYGAVVQDYTFQNTYIDQGSTLAATTLQTMGIAFLIIALVTALLMPDASSMFFICFSSLSVDLGVVGLVNVWGSDLDPVTMVCLLMTIGFSVYYTARICYCYQRADECWTTKRKLAFALGAMGWPILQGGLATWVGIIPLCFVGGYMTRTFFHTIFLVVAIGLLHGLLFIPVMMSLYDYRTPPFRNRRTRKPTENLVCC